MAALESTTSLPGEFDDQDEQPQAEDDLTYEQLRQLYDMEELARFLEIFEHHVTEVRVPTVEPHHTTGASGSSTSNLRQVVVDGDYEEDSWISLYDTQENWQGLSSDIAQKYVLPYLPPPAPPPPSFTFGRLRLSIERLYLFIVPMYIPFLLRLLHLAVWEDKLTSSIYCSIFWFLWFFDLIIPGLLLRVFYALIRRRIFPYPTLEELRARRREVEQADRFGGILSSRLTASSSLGVKEMWRLFRIVNKGNRHRIKKYASANKSRISLDDPQDDSPVDEESGETQQERDLKRLGLQLLTGLADLHERIKNLFMWRRPQASRIAAAFLLLSTLTTFILPTRLVYKLIYGIFGFIFWHVTPIIAAMNAQERARLPPPLAGVPTDAEYAMEVISMRVASGLDITTKSEKKSRAKRNFADESPQSALDGEKKTDGSKWNERAAIGKAWAGEGKRLIKRGVGKIEASPSTSPLIPAPIIAIGQARKPQTVYTFPCQHSSAPGLITLTPTTFYFTPFMGTNPRTTLLLNRLLGVKKTGLMKGLTLKFSSDDGTQHNEEIFRWVGNRDELFTRLVGLEGKRWQKG